MQFLLLHHKQPQFVSGHMPIERLSKVELKVSVIDLSESQKKLQVEIPSQNVQKEIEKRYRDLAKKVRIKGFRPGKIPRSILQSYYGKAIEGEVSQELIQETYPDALSKADIKPLIQADVDELHFEDSGAFTYSAIVEVCPPFELSEYKGLALSRPAINITEEAIDAEIERIRQQHGQLEALDEDRPIMTGDVAVVDFTPSVDGTVFEKGKTADMMVEVGKQSMHPDFDEQLVGHKAGETLAFDLDYPEDASATEIAGKRVHFDLTIKDVKKRILPDLDDDFAGKMGSDSFEAFREEIAKRLTRREEDRLKADVQEQIKKKLLENTKFELSPKVIEQEAEVLVSQFRHQFESQGIKVNEDLFNSKEIKAEYRNQAEQSIRLRLILSEIARREDIQLTAEEVEETYKEVARLLRKDISEVRTQFAENPFVVQLQDGKAQEKVLRLLEEHASFTEAEASVEAGSPDQE